MKSIYLKNLLATHNKMLTIAPGLTQNYSNLMFASNKLEQKLIRIIRFGPKLLASRILVPYITVWIDYDLLIWNSD